MSAPITESHKALWTKLYNLAFDEIFDDYNKSSDDPAHQLIADSEARAVEAADFALQQERNIHMTTIAERDRLRAEVELGEQLQAATEASLKTVTTERDQLRAEVINLTQSRDNWESACKANDACVVQFKARAERANARAERAEAELANIRALANRRNKQDHSHDTTHQLVASLDQSLDIVQAELASERARLDWLEDHGWVTGEPCGRVAIDAAMKEDAK
jgi:chromosome segregation ATPase